MKFEEFLRTHKITKHKDGWDCIFITDLGKWAWNKKQEYRIQAEKGRQYYMGMNDLCYELALACLGKKEIEKRLKELKRK